MIDELWNLVMSDDDGFVVQIRLESLFDEVKFNRIKQLLRQIINDLIGSENIPRKLLLIVTELLQHTVGGNNYMKAEDLIKLEDASIELIEIIANLYLEGE